MHPCVPRGAQYPLQVAVIQLDDNVLKDDYAVNKMCENEALTEPMAMNK